jgi:prepilin-type N-terminal cleavage/methylation domain-containing protein
MKLSAQTFKVFKKGFTLIELLVVIAVLGVLATIVLLAVNPGEQLARSRDTSRISSITQAGRALQAYYTTQSYYPRESTSWLTAAAAAGYAGGPVTTTDLKAAPTNPVYSSLPGTTVICTYATYAQGGVATGFCYRVWTSSTTLTDCNSGSCTGEAIVYQRLESTLNNSKCTTAGQYAYAVFSTANGREGLVCTATEPAPGTQTFVD